MIHSTFIFIVVLGVLIFFHELGHFLIARLFGVGVEKFSLGFGPRIFGKTVGRTDYRLSAIPLGGYVKMVGEEPDSELEPEEVSYSFTHKHVAKRSAIVAAGPVFNALLAIVIFALIAYFTGVASIRPIVRNVEPDSPAALAGIQTGDLVQAIDDGAIESWRGIKQRVVASDGQSLQLAIKRNDEMLRFDLAPYRVAAKNIFGDDDSYWDLGISGMTLLKVTVRGLADDMPAIKAGLQVDDHVIAINDKPIQRWQDMQSIVSGSNGEVLKFKIGRGSETFDVDITPQLIQEKDLLGVKQSTYRIGIQGQEATIADEDRITLSLNPLEAAGQGINATWEMIRVTVYFFSKMFQGKVPMENLGGPIRIAQMASQEAEQGVVRLLNFIAIISIQLAILNLLPIPVLDGGHLLFFGIEAIMRRPVSIRTRETAQQIGIFMLLLLMVFVFYNDIMMTWFR